MEDVNKKRSVTFSGMRPSRTFTKLAQRHTEKWIEREQSLQFLPKETSYSIHFDKESRNYFTCRIEVRMGSMEWNGVDEGCSIQDALLNALRSLHPKERVELYRPPVVPTSPQMSVSA